MNADARPLTVPDLLAMKAAGRRIVMLTCYDAAFARLLEQADVDVLLVGDSLNQVLAGHETTLSTTLDQMIYHAAAVRRGSRRALVFVDLPFLTYQVSIPEAIRNAGRVLQESGAHGVKLEGGSHMAETVGALVERGIPVIGHLGLTPQSVHALGGYRVQGRDASAADRLLSDAKALEAAGACAIVLELVPAEVAGRISKASPFPQWASAPARNAMARFWSCTTCSASTSSSPRSSSSTTPSWASRCAPRCAALLPRFARGSTRGKSTVLNEEGYWPLAMGYGLLLAPISQ